MLAVGDWTQYYQSGFLPCVGAIPTRFSTTPYAPLAQLEEQCPSKAWVAGPSPARSTI